MIAGVIDPKLGRYDPEERIAIQADLDAGMMALAVAAKYNRRLVSIYRHFRVVRKKRPGRPRAESRDAQIRELRATVASLRREMDAQQGVIVQTGHARGIDQHPCL